MSKQTWQAAAAMWSDPDVVRYIGGRAFNREEVWHRMLRYIVHWDVRPFGYWAIHDRSDDRWQPFASRLKRPISSD